MAPLSLRQMMETLSINKNETSIDNAKNQKHTSTTEPSGHPAIKTENGGRAVHIDISFDPSSEITLYRCDRDEEYIHSTSFFSVLSRYRKRAHFITIRIFFQHHPSESLAIKKTQGNFCQDLAFAIDQFHGLRKLDVGLSYPEFNWGQFRNAVSFYPLKFTGWSLHQQLGKGEWVRVQGNSALHRRLNGWNKKLAEEQTAKVQNTVDAKEEAKVGQGPREAAENQGAKQEGLAKTIQKAPKAKAKEGPGKAAKTQTLQQKGFAETKAKGKPKANRDFLNKK